MHFLRLGKEWRRQGKLDKADSLFKNLLKDSRQMSHSPIWLSRVKIYSDQEKFYQADSCFWAAVKNDK